MLEVIKQQLAGVDTLEKKLNKTREYLQIITLKILADKNYFENMAFVGGTALRVLFNLRRFSEDLDFSLVKKGGFDFTRLCSQLSREFTLYNVETEIAPKIERNVQSAWLKFPGLLSRIGLSNLKSQKLSIKIEVDTNPPAGWRLQSSIVNKVYIFNIAHFDLASLFSTKLHACFYRNFTKGRDFYDFVWYISRKTKPNFKLLNNAIRQTNANALSVNERNFKKFLLLRLEKIDFRVVKKDVERFLEDKNEVNCLELKPIQNTIEANY
ncbi:MAG: nucleotidyl transferase AbiEii/AbiGii toxin family protein [Candidatus Omnitrophota bacterium]